MQQQQNIALENDADISDNTSDTSSYASGHGREKDPNEEHKHEIQVPKEDKMQHEMLDEFEDNTVSSYAKFKTQNEIDLENIEKFAPPMPELDDLDDIIEFGLVQKFIEDGQTHVILVKPTNPSQIFDIDNIVCYKSKEVIGFVLDLIGQVNQPLYSVRVYQKYQEKLKSQGIEIKNQLLDAKLYLVVKSLKVINAQLPVIMSKKGCDASNIYDEEIGEQEREFSDDEKEREHKRAKKNKKKNKAMNDREIEEGEIEDQVNVKRKHHNKDFDSKYKKRFNDGKQGTQIPMYSTNYALNQPQPMSQQPQFNQAVQFSQQPYQYPQQQFPMFQQPQYQMPDPNMIYQNQMTMNQMYPQYQQNPYMPNQMQQQYPAPQQFQYQDMNQQINYTNQMNIPPNGNPNPTNNFPTNPPYPNFNQ